MPGGKIVVYEGLMSLVSSDDELAVVVGHEVRMQWQNIVTNG